ncbi:regulatory LuxR family protein [Mycobacterium sp. BK558]|nr:regulatory LuxR family protein [Mycobacterium sp. BK558]
MLVGRSVELTLVTDALAGISTSGAALVIDGEPGIGKSTLLAAAAEWASANGYARLGCVGLQSHTEVGFAGVHELLHPLLAHADALPPRQRAALMTAFGLEDGPVPDRLLIGLAVLGLLEEAASKRRLLLIVDDAQWLDQSSLDVLTFVSRRLTNAPLMMLCAVRTSPGGSAVVLDGLPRLSIGPLGIDEAAELLAAELNKPGVPRDLDPSARQRVLEQADGNPLAVIELTAVLGQNGHGSATFAGEPLPTSRRLERAFLNQLDALPEQSRLLLLLISAGDGSLAEIHRAAEHAGLNLTKHLAPLEESGLVAVGGGALRIRHPLIQSTVYGAAALSTRALVHRALACAATDPTRSAWHRAEATFGPDEQVAADLEQAAERARARGAGAEAAAALRRAAVLTDDLSERLRRLAAAAEVARSSGLMTESLRILQEAESLVEDHGGEAPLAITRFVLNATAATPGRTAAELLALSGKYPDGSSRQRELLWAAAIECRMHGLTEQTRQDIVAAIRRLDDDPLDPFLAIGEALVDDVGYGQRLRARLPSLVEVVGDSALLTMSLAFAAEAVVDRRSALRCWVQVQNQARRTGRPADECEGLRGAAHILLTEGRIEAAAISAQNALRMAEDMNLPMTAGSAAAILARTLVWQGQAERARQYLDRARQFLSPAPTILWNDDVHWAAGLAALCEANHPEALAHLLKMTLHRTSRRWAIADLAEAAAGADRHDAIRPLLAEIGDEAERLGVDSLLVHRAHALLADTFTEADERFNAALASAEGLGAELEVARTHLLYGAWLRRRRRIVDARTHLSVALTAFDTAGAVPFADRAASELRAAGVTAGSRPPSGAGGNASALTSQELQIAQMAAAGMTNREIADRIYLSHRTVAAHLYKVFPKLGITRRNQLHAALGQRADSAEPVI